MTLSDGVTPVVLGWKEARGITLSFREKDGKETTFCCSLDDVRLLISQLQSVLTKLEVQV